MPLSRKITRELPFMEQWRNPQTNKWLGKILVRTNKAGETAKRTIVHQQGPRQSIIISNCGSSEATSRCLSPVNGLTCQSQGAFNLRDQLGNSLVLPPYQPLVIPLQTHIHGRHIETNQHRNLDRQNFRGGDMPLHLRLNQIEDLTNILFRRVGVQGVLLPKNLKFDQPFQ